MMSPSRRLVTGLVLAGALSLGACGKDGSGGAQSQAAPPLASTATAPKADDRSERLFSGIRCALAGSSDSSAAERLPALPGCASWPSTTSRRSR